MTDTYILDDAKETVYSRPEQHGEPEDTFPLIADFWSSYLGVEVSPPDVAKMFVLMKVARSAEGHYDQDNPEDVAGYAENWARLEAERDEEDTLPKFAIRNLYRNGMITKENRDKALEEADN